MKYDSSNPSRTHIIQLLSLLIAIAGCSNSKSIKGASSKPDQPPELQKWGGLTVQTVGAELTDARHVVIMLHGFGAPGDDFVNMGRVMPLGPLTCFVFPEGPVDLERGRRAWWDRQGGFDEARAQVLELLKYVKRQNHTALVTLGGFSQGASMTSNFLATEPPLLDAAILLSPGSRMRHEPKHVPGKPVVFLSHGRQDNALSFAASEKLHQRLAELTYDVQWFPYDGGHTIPQELMLAVARFLVEFQNGKRTQSR